MGTYPLRALSKDGKEEVVFNLSDGPCKLDDNLFVLTAMPGSPILRYDSVLRGCDVHGAFEGDIFEHEGSLYTLRYLRGFAGVNSNKEVVYLEDIKQYNRVSSIYEEPNMRIPRLAKLTYKIGDVIFTLEDILGEMGDNLVVYANGGLITPSNSVQQYAGITHNKKTMYFGDLINDSPLVLKNGRCSININNNFVDIAKGDF